MIELPLSQFDIARPLFDRMKAFVIPAAVLAGYNPGRLFVDQAEHPGAAFLWTPCGYYFLAGQARSQDFQRALHNLLFETLIPPLRARDENGFILIPDDPSWAAAWPVILKGRQPIQIYRRLFHFNPARFNASLAGLRHLPETYRLQRIDSPLLAQYPELASEINVTWGGAPAFLAHGRGFCLLNGAELVSACLSVFASDTADEISIHTAEPFRRQGWGALVAAAFIQDCLNERSTLAAGRHPNWECFWDNVPSIKLAEKLAYTMQTDYPIYYWEEA